MYRALVIPAAFALAASTAVADGRRAADTRAQRNPDVLTQETHGVVRGEVDLYGPNSGARWGNSALHGDYHGGWETSQRQMALEDSWNRRGTMRAQPDFERLERDEYGRSRSWNQRAEQRVRRPEVERDVDVIIVDPQVTVEERSSDRVLE